MDKTASVDHDDIRFAFIIRHLIPSGCQKSEHDFRIRQILITSK